MAQAAPHLLIAYDGSPSAAAAVRTAASLFDDARAHVATVPTGHLSVGTASPLLPGVSPEVVQQALDELDAEARQKAADIAGEAVEQARVLGLEAEPFAAQPTGPTWAALLEIAHQVDADVLVCGTRGRGAFARALLGSTSTSLLHHTDLPLLIVPDDGGELGGPVVVAYDGSEGSTRAIQVVGRLLAGRPTVVVHVWEPVSPRSIEARATAAGAPVDDLHGILVELERGLTERAAETTEEGVAAARAAGLDAVGHTVEVDEGVWRAVASAARAHQASVIAVGTRGLGAARSVLLGSVSSGLARNAERPVLVVPAP